MAVCETDTAIFAVHTAFAETSYGAELAGRVRYERYNLAGLSNEEWVNLLGADVNNLTHMPLSYGMAKAFIHHQELGTPGSLTPREQSLLKLGLLIHDQGEAIIGDITYADKTDDDEHEEQTQFRNNLTAFCPDANEELLDFISEARDQVVFNSTNKLGRMRAAIEGSGYLRTALQASRAVASGEHPDATSGLRWLVADVLSNMTSKLLQYAGEYTPINTYLANVSKDITTAFTIPKTADFDNYGERRAFKFAEFITAQTAWQSWIKQAA